jgi:hypothetical protein
MCWPVLDFSLTCLVSYLPLMLSFSNPSLLLLRLIIGASASLESDITPDFCPMAMGRIRTKIGQE